eukprot:ANDGO_07206.mRNA.1 hypothetical protein
MGFKGLALGFIGDAIVKDVNDVKYPQLICDSCEDRLSTIENTFSRWMKPILKAPSNPEMGIEIQQHIPFVVSLLLRCFIASPWDKIVPEQNVSEVLKVMEQFREFLVQSFKPKKKKKKAADEPWKKVLWFMYVENYDIEKSRSGSVMDLLFKENMPYFDAFQPDCWVVPDGMCVHFGKFFFFFTFPTQGPLYDLVSKYANPLCDSHEMRTIPVLPLEFFELLNRRRVPVNQMHIGHPDLHRFLDSHPGKIPRITDGTKLLEQFVKQNKPRPGSHTPQKFFVDGDPEKPWDEWILKDMALRSLTMTMALQAEQAWQKGDFGRHGQLAESIWFFWKNRIPQFLIPGSTNWIDLPSTIEDVPVHYFILRLFQQYVRKLLIDALNFERRDRNRIQTMIKELDLFMQQYKSMICTSQGGLPGLTQIQTWETNRPILGVVARTLLLAKLVVHIKLKRALSNRTFSVHAAMCLRSSYTDVSLEKAKDIRTLMADMMKEYQALLERDRSFPEIHVQAFNSAGAPSNVWNCGRTSLAFSTR